MGYAANNNGKSTEDGANYSNITRRQHTDCIGCEDKVEHAMNDLCISCERNHDLPPGKPISSMLPAHIIGDILEVYEFVLRFYQILGFQEAPSFKELEQELTCSGFDQNVSQGSIISLLSNIYIKLLKLLMHEMQLTKEKLGRKKGTGCVDSAKGCQLHVFVNELTWPEMARRYVLALLSIKRSLASDEMNDSYKSRVLCCLRGDGRVICGSNTGVARIEEDANVLAEAIKRVFGSLDTGNDIQCIYSGNSSSTKAYDKAMLMETDHLDWSQVLEPVRTLRTNVGSRIRDCVRAALDKGPPLWAKEILEHSISKEVYKGNASGPTKRLVVSILDKLCSKDLNLQPDNERNNRKSQIPSEVIMRRCHFALRRSLADNQNKAICNLLSVQVVKFVENTEEGILESSIKVSRPLDFRTIDVRLAAGAYGSSYEAFLDDFRQVLANLRVMYANKPELVQLKKLSDRFKGHYENEVNSLFTRYGGCAEFDYMKLKKEVDYILNSSRKLPESPWEHNVCKVCGIDVDDEFLLLCDSCEEEYHTYCLKPPLKRVPRGKWFCPRCVETGKENSETTHNFNNLEDDNDVVKALKPLGAAITQKEFWEWSLDERVFLLKFLCGEALNSSVIRQHLKESADLHLSKLSLRREYMGADSCGRLYWVFSEPNRLPFLVVDQNSTFHKGFHTERGSNEQTINSSSHRISSPFPWVSYQSEEEIERLLEWFKEHDDGERQLKKSILQWKKTVLHILKKNDNEEELSYRKRNEFLTSLLAPQCGPPYDLEKGKKPSSSIAHEEHKLDEPLEIEMKPVGFGKADIFTRRLKMQMLDIEAALPNYALRHANFQQGKRLAWRSFLNSATTILEIVQALILLEDMMKTEYLKNWWWYWSCLGTAVKTPTLSALAMRIYALNSAIDYGKVLQPHGP